jgi:hypothetical protein
MSESHHEIHLTPEQKARLAKLASQVGKPWPEVFDEALAAYPPSPSQQSDIARSLSTTLHLALALSDASKGHHPI